MSKWNKLSVLSIGINKPHPTSISSVQLEASSVPRSSILFIVKSSIINIDKIIRKIIKMKQKIVVPRVEASGTAVLIW